MGDFFPHIVLPFTKNRDAFYDVLHCVLRRNALRFTKQ